MTKKPRPIQVPGRRVEKELLHGHHHKYQAKRLGIIMSEFERGFNSLKKYNQAASIFGSSRCGFDHDVYLSAETLAFKLAKDGYAIITGGGPGIMEAANKGAKEAQGHSVGMNIKLPNNQPANKFLTDSEDFNHFFVRKVMLAFASQVYIFFPGGFGTLDEFFEIITLVQTKKINPIPVILIDKEYWAPLLRFIENTIYRDSQAIDKKDMSIYHLVDNADEAYQLINQIVKVKK